MRPEVMLRLAASSLAVSTMLVGITGPVRAASSHEATPRDALTKGFIDPPNSARPRVWWHWINGNITKDGIAKDLDWMHRVGIGGVQNFDVGLTSAKVVDNRLIYMTPEWKDAFRFAASTADRLGLEMAISSSPGWSETAGPWVQPRDAMKKLVWSETRVEGGTHFHGPLPAPPSTTGPYQALAMSNAKSRFYADALVLAFPDTAPAQEEAPVLTLPSGEPVDAALLAGDGSGTAVALSKSAGDTNFTLLATYRTPQTIRSATLYVRNAASMFNPAKLLPQLEVRADGEWRQVAKFPLSDVPTTISFAPATGREFRVVFASDPTVGSDARMPAIVRVAQFGLSAQPKVNAFETKAGFAVARDYYALPNDPTPEAEAVSPEQVIDLSTHMNADGVLDWTPPPGRWRVLRLGYSLLGVTNHPAAPEATGLEVDKYDADAVRSYMDTYIGMYRDAAGPALIGSHGVRAILTDSIEVGSSNWTPRMVELFRQARGYDPRPWLPALTGQIIGSRAQSDAFLYDFRRTLEALIADAHYGQVARSAHEAGLTVYGESQEGGRTSLGDDMTMRAHADIPMAALWTYDRATGPSASALADMRGAASVAHVYGRPFVAAESMTSSLKPWAFAPADLRPVVDLEFASGINRPVIHTSVHQPLDKAPGLSLSIFGQYFNRLESWAEMARPWVDYIARSSYLLQQGRNVADVAYFSGEEAPLTRLHGDEPTRHAYDFVNADMVRDALSVEGNTIVAKGGARYSLLYLGGSSRRMTLPTLRRLADLVSSGGTIAGDAPIGSPSLNDDPAEYQRLVRQLWAGGAITQVGKGRVVAGKDVEAALAAIGIAPDFSYAKPASDSEMLFLHRRTQDADIYFVDNRKPRAERIEARFRVSGKMPEIWHADTGRSEPASYRQEGGQTVVTLPLGADESCFVVFRTPSKSTSMRVADKSLVPLGTIDGGWTVDFQPGRGAPQSINLPALASLSEQADPRVKYFSGTATYRKSFQLPRGASGARPLWLDLGKIGDVAEVRVNGRLAGTAWKAPYRVDLAGLVRSGRNALEIRVANLWVNRLVGDAQPGAQKVTFTIFPTYGANAPLRPSGLIGPVRLETERDAGAR